MSRVPTFAGVVLMVALAGSLDAAKSVEIYFIDTEGGQATLVVSSSGQSLLIDAGYAGNSGRDAIRIAAAAKSAGVKRIDFLLVTHHHPDHVGGVGNLLERLPIGTYLDHGPSVEMEGLYPEPYSAAFAKGEHKVVQAGDKIPVKGLEVTVLAAAGRTANRGGDANPYCEGLAPHTGEAGEDPQSVAVLIQFGKFRFAEFGDLRWNGELALECPENRIGHVDVFLAPRHTGSESPKSVWALAPRVVVMNYGPRKGGLPTAWKLLRETPGVEDLWQLHFAIAAGSQSNASEANAADAFIANLDERGDAGFAIKVTASEDGSFTVTNPRNKFAKSYAAK